MMIDDLVSESADSFGSVGPSSSLPSSLVAVPTFVPPSSPPSLGSIALENMVVGSDPDSPFQFVGISSPTYLPPAPVPDMTDTPSLQSLVINQPGDSEYVPGLPSSRETDSPASRAAKYGTGLAIAAALALWFLLD